MLFCRLIFQVYPIAFLKFGCLIRFKLFYAPLLPLTGSNGLPMQCYLTTYEWPWPTEPPLTMPLLLRLPRPLCPWSIKPGGYVKTAKHFYFFAKKIFSREKRCSFEKNYKKKITFLHGAMLRCKKNIFVTNAVYCFLIYPLGAMLKNKIP